MNFFNKLFNNQEKEMNKIEESKAKVLNLFQEILGTTKNQTLYDKILGFKKIYNEPHLIKSTEVIDLDNELAVLINMYVKNQQYGKSTLDVETNNQMFDLIIGWIEETINKRSQFIADFKSSISRNWEKREKEKAKIEKNEGKKLWECDAEIYEHKFNQKKLELKRSEKQAELEKILEQSYKNGDDEVLDMQLNSLDAEIKRINVSIIKEQREIDSISKIKAMIEEKIRVLDNELGIVHNKKIVKDVKKLGRKIVDTDGKQDKKRQQVGEITDVVFDSSSNNLTQDQSDRVKRLKEAYANKMTQEAQNKASSYDSNESNYKTNKNNN